MLAGRNEILAREFCGFPQSHKKIVQKSFFYCSFFSFLAPHMHNDYETLSQRERGTSSALINGPRMRLFMFLHTHTLFFSHSTSGVHIREFLLSIIFSWTLCKWQNVGPDEGIKKDLDFLSRLLLKSHFFKAILFHFFHLLVLAHMEI